MDYQVEARKYLDAFKFEAEPSLWRYATYKDSVFLLLTGVPLYVCEAHNDPTTVEDVKLLNIRESYPRWTMSFVEWIMAIPDNDEWKELVAERAALKEATFVALNRLVTPRFDCVEFNTAIVAQVIKRFLGGGIHGYELLMLWGGHKEINVFEFIRYIQEFRSRRLLPNLITEESWPAMSYHKALNLLGVLDIDKGTIAGKLGLVEQTFDNRTMLFYDMKRHEGAEAWDFGILHDRKITPSRSQFTIRGPRLNIPYRTSEDVLFRVTDMAQTMYAEVMLRQQWLDRVAGKRSDLTPFYHYHLYMGTQPSYASWTRQTDSDLWHRIDLSLRNAKFAATQAGKNPTRVFDPVSMPPISEGRAEANRFDRAVFFENEPHTRPIVM